MPRDSNTGTVIPEGAAFVYIHQDGCGRPAFFLRTMPKPYGIIHTENVILNDGSAAIPGTTVHCCSCQYPINPSISHIRPVSSLCPE